MFNNLFLNTINVMPNNVSEAKQFIFCFPKRKIHKNKIIQVEQNSNFSELYFNLRYLFSSKS